jgi:hypothetical protein
MGSSSSSVACATAAGTNTPPQPIDRHTAERIALGLYNMGQKGKPFQPEYIALDFGASAVSRSGVSKSLYGLVLASKDGRTQDFFKQWKILFSEVCGFDVEASRRQGAESSARLTASVRQAKPAPLFFAVHTYYTRC